MEDDKKKRKKNKKKKNKQVNEPTESDKLEAKELTSESESHVQERGQNNNGQVSDIVDVSNDNGGHSTVEGDEHLVNGNEVIHLAEEEKQYWLDREATLEGKIKEIQAEKDAQIQKEASLEDRIKQLMKENDGHSGKEATLEGKIKELQAEKDAQIQKEASLEERIKQLMKENDGNSGKEASQNGKIKQLNDEKNASLRNEARLKEILAELEKEKDALIWEESTLENNIQQLQREMDAQLQKMVSLENEIVELKGEKDSWVQKEDGFEAKFKQLADEASLLNVKLNSANESIASLTIDNAKLKAQVVELELEKESLFGETREQKEFISVLQLRVSNLEMDKKISENGDANNELEAAHALVERLMSENAELVEKINALHAELEQSGVRTKQSLSNGDEALVPDPAVEADESPLADEASGASKKIPVSDSTQSLEDVMVKDERNGELVNVNSSPRAVNSPEITEAAGEIEQIPLDEIELKKMNKEVAPNGEEVDVSLTDSPLIGAPFRLISFVASYVSGADLVHKK